MVSTAVITAETSGPLCYKVFGGCNGRQLVVVADHSADVQLNERWMSGPADIEC